MPPDAKDHPAEADLEAIAAAQAEADPIAERFRDLAQDTPILKEGETELSSWVMRMCGDQQPYNKGEGTVSYAVAVIKSLRWPGAITVSKQGKQPCSIYVGDGIKKGDSCYNPTEPPQVQSDPEGQVEMPEPTPFEPPELEPEDDTDNPKKKKG